MLDSFDVKSSAIVGASIPSVSRMKEEARKLKKENDMNSYKALKLVANKYGFTCWADAILHSCEGSIKKNEKEKTYEKKQ